MSGIARVLFTALAVAAISFAALTLVVRARPISNILGLVVSLGSPYAPFVALAGLVCAALSRRTLLTIV